MTARPAEPPVSALPGLLRKLATDRLGLMRDAAALGDAVRVAIGPKKLYIFNHPDYAKHVLADNSDNYHKGIGLVQARSALGDGLLTSEGPVWRKQRRTVQPAFKPARIAQQAETVAEEAEKFVALLARHEGAAPVNLMHLVTQLTLGVLGRTLLDTGLDGYGEVAHAFEAVQDQAMFDMVTMDKVPAWLPLPRQRRFRTARRELHRIADALIADRRGRMSGGAAPDDALARMILAAAEAESVDGAPEQLRDELVTLLLAGHETTASTLGWTFHLLDRHPEVREKVRQEAREILGDRAPVLDDLHRLSYTTMVIQEVMRLYPPVWVLPRIAQRADNVGGYEVSAGADVLISPYILHRHPGLWTDPERFDPERFDPQRVAHRPRYAYIPFGAGPRYCVGSNLGMMEAVFVTALVTRDLTLDSVPGHKAVPEAMLSLRMADGLPMTVGRNR
ncbi:cytochrome P450 [Streptomyces sp. NBC_00209]|uniref:cytochrome P450 n=1 Tax=Streptomyces sp. NBC_00209 TaxID=2975682 RepID=UPI002F91589C